MKTVAINNAFEFARNGVSIKQEDGKTGIPITRIETIWDSSIDKNRFGFADITDDIIKSFEKYLLIKGDILMTHINSPKHLGKCAIYNNEPEKLIHGMNLLCLRPKVDILFPKFALYFFNSEEFKSNIPRISNQSVNQASFSAGNLKEIQIPLPPLSTQKHIAAILDAADLYRQKTKTLVAKYDQLAQSLFLEMFGDPVRNPKGWEKTDMNRLCSFKKESILPENIKKSTKYIGLESIEKETGNILDINEVTEGELKSNKFVFDENYILYGKLRPYLNKVALPNFNGICSTDIIPIKPIKDKSNRQFICQIMRSTGFVSFAHERSSGANLPRISPSEIEKYPIITPPISLQTQFATRIQLIEAQKQQALASLQKSETLFNSLLQRAFKGELVAE